MSACILNNDEDHVAVFTVESDLGVFEVDKSEISVSNGFDYDSNRDPYYRVASLVGYRGKSNGDRGKRLNVLELKREIRKCFFQR